MDLHLTCLYQTIDMIGQDRISNIMSDSTSVTKATRLEVTDAMDTILNFCDCCHHLHLTFGDISKLPVFSQVCDLPYNILYTHNHPHQMMQYLKHIIAYFSRATRARALLRETGSDNGSTTAVLQKIGKICFGSHYSGANSVLASLSGIRELIQRKEFKFKV